MFSENLGKLIGVCFQYFISHTISAIYFTADPFVNILEVVFLGGFGIRSGDTGNFKRNPEN